MKTYISSCQLSEIIQKCFLRDELAACLLLLLLFSTNGVAYVDNIQSFFLFLSTILFFSFECRISISKGYLPFFICFT